MKNYHKMIMQTTIDQLEELYNDWLAERDEMSDPSRLLILDMQISQMDSTIKLLKASMERADNATKSMMSFNVSLN